jgi:methionyl-tRNA formyltransferase
MMENNQRINFAFWGTPEVASDTLEILKRAGFLPKLIITAPDQPKGRGLVLTPPPVKVWAVQNGIPYIQPETADIEKQADIDLNIVVAYGKIIPEAVLYAPKHGSINIHYSLLPKYRGASPVESAVLLGDKETGVTIQKMVFKLDAGPILMQESAPIGPDELAPELKRRLTALGGEMLVKFLKDPNFEGREQDEGAVFHSRKIKKEDGLLDLSAPAKVNYNKFRAYSERPRTYFFENGKRIIVTDAALEDGKFVIKKVIPEGGKERAY